jgi:hypothetical protein
VLHWGADKYGPSIRYRPPVSIVARFKVVTDDGKCRICSPSFHPDLFAMLGGLEQFGDIARTHIPLQRALKVVLWTSEVYASFATYTADAKWLVMRPLDAAIDYMEGFAFVTSGDSANGWSCMPITGGTQFVPSLFPASAKPVLYCLEVALHQYAHSDRNEFGILLLALVTGQHAFEFNKASGSLHSQGVMLELPADGRMDADGWTWRAAHKVALSSSCCMSTPWRSGHRAWGRQLPCGRPGAQVVPYCCRRVLCAAAGNAMPLAGMAAVRLVLEAHEGNDSVLHRVRGPGG